MGKGRATPIVQPKKSWLQCHSVEHIRIRCGVPRLAKQGASVSTVIPQGPDQVDDPGEPIQNRAQLVEYFQSGEKAPGAFRVGTEHEKFGFLIEDHAPLPYDGPRGIESIFRAILQDEEEAKTGPWLPVEENGRIIALYKNQASISLEPGGQLELSGAPLASLHETCVEVGSHLKLLKRVCLPRGVGFVGLGFHPSATLAEMPDVPKSRYGIMQRYMPKKGARGLDMMKRTCTVQANFDYENEAHMVHSVRAALMIAPLATALFANSPFREGKLSGALSERTMVWQDTDPDRSGFPDIVFSADFGFERWVDFVLDVPMYFIRRNGQHLDYAGADFRVFLEQGYDGHRATLRDFEDHLTTVFTEVRIKRFMEVRSADCGPWSRICALPALYKPVFYDKMTLDAVSALMDEPTVQELRTLQRDAALEGFRACYRGQPILAKCERLLQLCSEGLLRLSAGEGGRDERVFLRPLIDTVTNQRTFAEELIDQYQQAWGASVEPLWGQLEFLADVHEA